MSLHDIANKVHDAEGVQYPDPVKGRVLYADADSFCYHCARPDDETPEENMYYLVRYMNELRLKAGAETMENHLTMGDKGRHHIAVSKPYQGNRTYDMDDPYQKRVQFLKHFLDGYRSPVIKPVSWLNQEADDGLCQAMYKADFSDQAVLYSPDKDLRMVPGYYMDHKTFDIHYRFCSPGNLWRRPDNNKIEGHGMMWFFFQLLAGDRADNIPGLSHLHKSLLPESSAMMKIREELRTKRNLTTKQIRQRNEKLIQLQKDRKHKQCGDATAYSYLNQYSTERQFYAAVCEAYRRCYTPPGVLNAKLSTQDEMTWKEIFHEQARLLWLKREPDEDVVTDYLDLL